MMAIYSDTLHWLGISPIFDPITDFDLITEFDFLPNCERFPLNICNECGMSTEDAYASGHLVMPHFGTCKCSNVETNLSWTCLGTDFPVSNIPRYFCFCFRLQTKRIAFSKNLSIYLSNKISHKFCLRWNTKPLLAHGLLRATAKSLRHKNEFWRRKG